MNTGPFFNANLIVTNAAGEYYGIRSTINLAAYENFIQIGQSTFGYEKLLEMKATGNRLFVQCLDESNKSCEIYLKYNTFLPSTAPKRLRELVKRVSSLIPKLPAQNLVDSNFVLASEIPTEGSLNEVVIHSSKVSFPPFCPACLKPASKIAKFEVTSIVPASDFLKIGFWLIPVCHAHANLSGHITVKNWSPGCGEIFFSFKNRLYAQAFLQINQAPLNNRLMNSKIAREQLERVRNLKFVIYEYYISALFFSFLHLSDVQELKKNENQFIRGLKYNAITLTAGWWSFPFGPVYTIIVLFKNLFGGTDVTPRVLEVFQGKPFSATDE